MNMNHKVNPKIDGIEVEVKGEYGHKFVITLLDNEFWIEDYDEFGILAGKIAFLYTEFHAILKKLNSLGITTKQVINKK